MLAKPLYKLTGNLPCRLIKVHNKPYLERYYLGKFFGFTFFIHRFLASDGDRFVHDHPWKWAIAIILAGRYKEEKMLWLDPEKGWVSRYRNMFPGKINYIPAQSFHRILDPQKETWTLFIHSKRVKNWGFLKYDTQNNTTSYHQPEEVKSSRKWYLNAKKGKQSKREPLQQ